mmetsp:Transcript_7398/g.11700  ORF Transcript_7398/g.11700 Transcript_7398/m.11700 type:complete len:89 (-) Transcript_7398:88-354(-)
MLVLHFYHNRLLLVHVHLQRGSRLPQIPFIMPAPAPVAPPAAPFPPAAHVPPGFIPAYPVPVAPPIPGPADLVNRFAVAPVTAYLEQW